MRNNEPAKTPAYLAPYLAAARKHGAGFRSLLWASPGTQAIRFRAVAESVNLQGKRLLDVGCGRGDLYDYLLNRGVVLAEYIGIEAVSELANAARTQTGCTIIEADFVAEPNRLFVGAELVCIVGSLNTLLAEADFEATLLHAFNAASEAVILNFLCDATRAGAAHLRFRSLERVCGLFEKFGASQVDSRIDYLDGDATVVAWTRQDGTLSPTLQKQRI
jgi:hypothetical protein